ncbi:polysaccharide biosynthesis/export family protein [bacterium]|nr:polysaccharide biosynthesis/export family protein [bacterium]
MKDLTRVFVMGLLAVATSGCIRYADIDQCMTRHKLRTLEKRYEQFNGTYQLGMPDTVNISIPDHPDLSGNYMLRPDGNISFPLLGDVYVEGLTPMQLSDLLAKRLERFVKKVEVLATVSRVDSKVVFMYDRTRNGGRAFRFDGDHTVLDVLTMQGGWLRNEAFASRVRLVRNNPEEREVYRIRADRFVRGDLRTNVLVREDDIVYVPATWMAEIVYFVEMVTRPITSLGRAASDMGTMPYETRSEYYQTKLEYRRAKEDNNEFRRR